VIETVTGEQISSEDLGGSLVHNTKSGNAHLKAKSEEEALDMVKSLLNYLPDQQGSSPKKLPYKAESDDENRNSLIEIVPYDDRNVYDVKKVIEEIEDENSFFELHKEFAKNIVVGFDRIRGQCIGLVCNQPKYMAGGLDSDSSDKAARFIRFCDDFNVPILTLQDDTGLFPGIKQEHGGIIGLCSKLF